MIQFDNAVLRNGEYEVRADFTLHAPNIYAIVGPSGSGKSTLLLGLAGFVPVHGGRIIAGDVDITRLAPAARPVSMLFQDHNLFAHLNVHDNVALGLRPNLRLSDQERAQVHDALARTGLDKLADRKPSALSGGQQQRVAIARAILRDRPVLLLDEAFSALGPGLRREMLALVRDVAVERGLTVLMVTHEPEDAHAIADQVIFVDRGTVHSPLANADFFERPPPAVARYLGLQE